MIAHSAVIHTSYFCHFSSQLSSFSTLKNWNPDLYSHEKEAKNGTLFWNMCHSKFLRKKGKSLTSILLKREPEKMDFWRLKNVRPLSTMCDFHYFGLTFFSVIKCVLGGCTITSKTKINVFWHFFFTPGTLRATAYPYRNLLGKILLLAKIMIIVNHDCHKYKYEFQKNSK